MPTGPDRDGRRRLMVARALHGTLAGRGDPAGEVRRLLARSGREIERGSVSEERIAELRRALGADPIAARTRGPLGRGRPLWLSLAGLALALFTYLVPPRELAPLWSDPTLRSTTVAVLLGGAGLALSALAERYPCLRRYR